MKYYKVCGVEKGKIIPIERYYSAIADKRSGFRIRYRKNKKVKARSGTLGLFCFEGVENAINFTSVFTCTNVTIFEVEALSKVTYPKIIASPTVIPFFYHSEKVNSSNSWHTTNEIPKGTVCINKIKMGREMVLIHKNKEI